MKKYYILDNAGADYNLIETEVGKGTLLELYSGEMGWTHPNSFICSVLNTGNDLKFKFEKKIKLKEVQYCQAEYLRFLLNFIESQETIKVEYSIKEEIKKI